MNRRDILLGFAATACPIVGSGDRVKYFCAAWDPVDTNERLRFTIHMREFTSPEPATLRYYEELSRKNYHSLILHNPSYDDGVISGCDVGACLRHLRSEMRRTEEFIIKHGLPSRDGMCISGFHGGHTLFPGITRS